jgi:hypothetical protein
LNWIQIPRPNSNTLNDIQLWMNSINLTLIRVRFNIIQIQLKRNEMQIGVKGIEKFLMAMLLENKTLERHLHSILLKN